MKKELENNLLEYLGELMHQSENEFDWIEKDKIVRKINAVNTLLGIPGEIKSTMQKVVDYVQTIQ